MSARDTPVLRPCDAIDRLLAPGALERYSPLTGDAVLLVDFRSSQANVHCDADTLLRVRECLTQLPCPSVALAPADDPALGAQLLDRFDVVLDEARDSSGSAEPTEWGRLVGAIERNPQAACALVQLLRLSDGLHIHEALVAESLAYSTLQSGPEFARWLAERPASQRAPAHSTPAVQVERIGARLVLTLDRPERRNAFSSEVRDALCEALQVATVDASLHEIVLRGNGSAFCSGGDLSEFGTLSDPATAHAVRCVRSAGRLLAACGTRVRAELHGACVGAGIEVPAFAARVVASEEAFFQLPEVGMGLVPGAGGTASIPRRIGRQRSAYMALSGDRIDATTALEWGLVDAIGDADTD